MEWNVLVLETKSINDLVKQYKSDIASSAREGFFQSREHLSADLSFDAGDGIPATKLLVFLGAYYANMPYCVLVVFSREAEGKWRAFISVIGEATRHASTDLWLGIVDRFTKPILASLKRVKTVYSSAWIFDGDEMVREKAASALQQMDASIAVEPLINLLRHDESDAIRESAARSLGQIGTEEAANALQRAVNNYIHGDRSRHGVAAACAEALGTMASRGSLEDLRKLLEIFEKNLSTQARTVKKAIYRIEHGRDVQETICIVCNQPAEEGSVLLQCPACKGVAHREHILEWLHVKNYCPACRKHLDAQSLVQPSSLPRDIQNDSKKSKAAR